MQKPKGFEKELGEFAPQFFDSWSGEPVAWGFKVVRRLDDDVRWNELKHQGKLECDHAYPNPGWYLIVKELTIDEAVAKYGDITHVKVGPKGGFQNVTFGKKTFCSDSLWPGNVVDFKTDARVEWDPPTEAMKALAKRNKLRKAARERAKAKKAATKLAKKGQK